MISFIFFQNGAGWWIKTSICINSFNFSLTAFRYTLLDVIADDGETEYLGVIELLKIYHMSPVTQLVRQTSRQFIYDFIDEPVIFKARPDQRSLGMEYHFAINVHDIVKPRAADPLVL
jgi:hypothetical protein